MKTTREVYVGIVVLGTAVLLTALPARLHAQQSIDAAIRKDATSCPISQRRITVCGCAATD